MSIDEVKAILGPPGDYSTQPVWSHENVVTVSWPAPPQRNGFGWLAEPQQEATFIVWYRWQNNTAIVTVDFDLAGDQDGRAVSAACSTTNDDIYDKLKRFWHRWFA
jgi:hypothetical protein